MRVRAKKGTGFRLNIQKKKQYRNESPEEHEKRLAYHRAYYYKKLSRETWYQKELRKMYSRMYGRKYYRLRQKHYKLKRQQMKEQKRQQLLNAPKFEYIEVKQEPDSDLEKEEIVLNRPIMEGQRPKKSGQEIRKCSVAFCPNIKTGDLTFFSFPKEEILKEYWRVTCQISTVYTTTLVCAEHFLPEDFHSRRMLKKGVVPTQNLPGSQFGIIQNAIEPKRTETIVSDHNLTDLSGLVKVEIEESPGKIQNINTEINISDNNLADVSKLVKVEIEEKPDNIQNINTELIITDNLEDINVELTTKIDVEDKPQNINFELTTKVCLEDKKEFIKQEIKKED